MKIREYRESDKADVNRLYHEYYMLNEYPSYLNGKYKSPFAITNDEDRIILAGGVKNLVEVCLTTDKSLPVKTRLDALLQALGSSIFIASEMGHKEMYAFITHDETYVKTLQRYGFKLIDAKLLVLNFGDFHE